MEVFCYSPPEGYPNFGDELNRWMWPQLLPNLHSKAQDTFMLGIGTILNTSIEEQTNKYKRVVVFGSGFGYGVPPKSLGQWRFFCVRGPHTAKALGLSSNVAVTDPGALVAKLVKGKGPNPKGKIGYMPHFRWGHPTPWKEVCKDSDVLLIDPRQKIEAILEQMLSVRVLLTEAMHGAIVGDCLRVPWIPIVSHPKILISKWQDWADSLNLQYTPQPIRNWWTYIPEKRGMRGRFLKYVFANSARNELIKIAETVKPVLSSDTILNTKLSRLDEELDRLNDEYLR